MLKFPNIILTSVLKFIELLQTNNTSLFIKLSIYSYKAFTVRNS